MKFNSQICTSKVQSERLLALGLKKETADMCYKVTTHDFKGNEINEIDRHYTLCCWYGESSLVCGLERKETIPAWSLHRLIEMINEEIQTDWESMCLQDEVFTKRDNLYDNIIDCIEWLIKEGYFNKEYLV